MQVAWEDDDLYIEDEYWDEQAAPELENGGCLLGALPLVAISINSSGENVQAEQEVIQSASNAADEPVADSGNASSGKLAQLFTPEVLYWEDAIVKWAQKNDLDPNLVATVMQIESCGDPYAESNAGAKGLFQVMPYHFAAGEDPFDPATNAARGMAYLANALTARNSDARLALASYNGGITGASRPESQWAAETQRYAHWGGGIYADAVKGKKSSSRLQEWLSAGGSGLCTQASQRLGISGN